MACSFTKGCFVYPSFSCWIILSVLHKPSLWRFLLFLHNSFGGVRLSFTSVCEAFYILSLIHRIVWPIYRGEWWMYIIIGIHVVAVKGSIERDSHVSRFRKRIGALDTRSSQISKPRNWLLEFSIRWTLPRSSTVLLQRYIWNVLKGRLSFPLLHS